MFIAPKWHFFKNLYICITVFPNVFRYVLLLDEYVAVVVDDDDVVFCCWFF